MPKGSGTQFFKQLNGMMEYWNVGKMGRRIKKNLALLKPNIPLFHLSNIPLIGFLCPPNL